MKQWDWLEQLKKRNRMEKNVRQPELASNSAMVPVSDRYNVGAKQPNDTGYGEDGQLQTNKPVAMFNTMNGPRMVHEGERMEQEPNGGTRVLSQAELVEIEKGKNMPGYKCGGKMPGYAQGGVMPGPAIPKTGTASPERGATSKTPIPDPWWKNPDPVKPDPWWKKMGPKTKDTGVSVDPNTPLSQTNTDIQSGFNIDPNTPLSQTNTDIQSGFNIDPNTPIDKPVQIDNINKMPDPIGIKPIGPTNPSFSKDALNSPAIPVGSNPTVDPNAIGQVPITPTDAAKNYKTIGGTTSPDQQGNIPDDKDPYEQQFQDALGKLGQMSGYDKERQKYLDDLKATQATEDLVNAQRRAQAGVGDVEGRTAGLMGQRMHGQELSGAYSETAIGAMNLAEQANMQKAQLALQGMNYATNKDQWEQQFDFAKKQYGDQQGSEIAKLINQGYSLSQIQQMFPDQNITQSDYDQIQKWSPMGWQQDAFEKQFGFAVQQYGDLEGQRIADAINNGETYEQIKAKWPQVTQEDYDQMQDWSPTGMNKEQWGYQKKVDTFNTLLGQGGAANLKKAADLFNEVFGTNIDFSNALTEENKQKFNESWNNMSGAIASGLTFDEWKKSAQASGDWDNMNMPETDIKNMYENQQLQSNPIYNAIQKYDELLEKDIISQEEYDKIVAALTFGLTNPEGFTYSDSYGVFDENNKEIKNFQTQEEADKYMAENPDKNYSVNMIPDGWVGYSGSGTGDNTGPDPDDPDVISDEAWDKMSLQEKSDSFLDTIPVDKLEDWDYDKWIAEGKPKTFDEWESQNIGTVEDVEKIVSDYKEKGWPSYDVAVWKKNEPDVDWDKWVKDGRDSFIERQGDVNVYNTDDWIGSDYDELKIKESFKNDDLVMFKGDSTPYKVIRPPYGSDKRVILMDLSTGKTRSISWRQGKAFWE